MAKEKIDDTNDMLAEFNKLCEKYAYENIDTEKLKQGVEDTINNWSG